MSEGRLDEARAHLEALVRDPGAGPEIHYNLAMVLSRLHEFEAAAASFEYCSRFAPDNLDILNNLANALRLSGQLAKSAKVFDRALTNNPGHTALLCNRGWLHLALKDNRAAVSDFRAALDSNNDIEDAWRGLTKSLLAVGDMEQACSVSRQALDKFPGSCDLHNLRGVFHTRQKQLEKALPCFKQSVSLFAGNAEVLTNLGITAEQLGDLSLAEKSLVQALQVKPGYPPAWFHLANLASWQPAAEHIPAIEAALNAAKDHSSRVDLEFALANTLRKLKQYEHAFPHFVAARKSMAAQQAFDLEAAIAELDKTGSLPPELETAPPKRLFIVGMPRSGTTLVDQVLAAHSDVYSRGDSGIAARLEKKVTKTTAASNETLAQWLRQQMPIPHNVQRVVDTSPGHFSQWGRLASLLPEARFILCLRNPLDTCVSIFEQPLTGNHAYANTLAGLGRYYRACRLLMERWQALLGERLLTVHYEQLVTSPEIEIARLLEHCELDLQQSCLDFHQYQRAVMTPSAAQVKQPMNTHSIGRWRNYEQFLQPLIEQLPKTMLHGA